MWGQSSLKFHPCTPGLQWKPLNFPTKRSVRLAGEALLPQWINHPFFSPLGSQTPIINSMQLINTQFKKALFKISFVWMKIGEISLKKWFRRASNNNKAALGRQKKKKKNPEWAVSKPVIKLLLMSASSQWTHEASLLGAPRLSVLFDPSSPPSPSISQLTGSMQGNFTWPFPQIS